jgi:hypothetical protein
MKAYFVSYMYWEGRTQGVGCRQLNIKNPVAGWDDIQAMASEIQRLNPKYTEVIILNWRRFEDPE